MVDRFENNGSGGLNNFSKLSSRNNEVYSFQEEKIKSPNSSNIQNYNQGKSGNLDNEK